MLQLAIPSYRYADTWEKRWRRFERPVGGSWRVDETFIKIRGQLMYLYRAVDGQGNTVEFCLSRTRSRRTPESYRSDNPICTTMYVDKILSGIKAVQTLSRLNRAHPKKHDVFVLDFRNHVHTIQEAFADYYRTTILSEETDPNTLHDLKAALDGYQVYANAEIDQLVTLYLVDDQPLESQRHDPFSLSLQSLHLSTLGSPHETEKIVR